MAWIPAAIQSTAEIKVYITNKEMRVTKLFFLLVFI